MDLRVRSVTQILVLGCLLAAVERGTSEKRVVCYHTNWSIWRQGTAKFSSGNIDPHLCTHLMYAFAGFDEDNGLKSTDPHVDIEKGEYESFTGLKTSNKNLKTMLSVGGWNEGSSRFAPIAADPERRKQFATNSVEFLRRYNFDGLDLDWQNPTFRDGGTPGDRENYVYLVQELREAYERESSTTGRPRLLLSMGIPSNVEYVDQGYDILNLNKYLDFISILSYDYHSALEPAVNHHAPLYPPAEDKDPNFNAELTVDFTVKHVLKSGASPDKVVLGIPAFGRSYTLLDEDATDIGSPTDGPGLEGDVTEEKGYLAYFEICASFNNSGEWTIVSPHPNAMGPYAFSGNQWVGYDDEAIVRRKAQYVNEQGLGGITFWAIDTDDFNGKCHNRPYPLIEAAKEVLLNVSSDKRAERNEDAPRIKNNENQESPEEVVTTPASPPASDPGTDFKCERKGFFSHPRDRKKYFWCSDAGPGGLGMVAHHFTCPADLVFNKAADSCDYPRNVVRPKSEPSEITATQAPAAGMADGDTMFRQAALPSITTITTEIPQRSEPETSTPRKSRPSAAISNGPGRYQLSENLDNIPEVESVRRPGRPAHTINIYNHNSDK